jgi:hypothetical protein
MRLAAAKVVTASLYFLLSTPSCLDATASVLYLQPLVEIVGVFASAAGYDTMRILKNYYQESAIWGLKSPFYKMRLRIDML